MYVLLFFPLAFAIVFKFLPLLGLSVAFLNYDVVGGFERAKFIGFDAFKEIFKMKDFYIALRNTIVLNGLDLIIGFPAPIILAILLNEIRNKYFKRISQTVLYLPQFSFVGNHCRYILSAFVTVYGICERTYNASRR